MRTLVVAALALSVTATLPAQQTTRITLAPTSSVKVEGTSNVHDWHMTTSSIEANIEVAVTKASELGSSVKAVTVVIPVKSLKSGKGGMDNNAYKAMNADANPTIRYRMTAYRATPQKGAYAATVEGMLTINGIEKPMTLQATVTPDGKGGVQAVGSTTFKTTEFGVKPVKAMMGAIKTGEEVTIRFTLTGAAAQALAQLQ